MSGRLRVAVLLGGQSSEHDVSILSARNVVKGLDAAKYDVAPILITRDGRWRLIELENGVLPDQMPSRGTEVALTPGGRGRLLSADQAAGPLPPIDILFPVLHGLNGEDGSIQGLAQIAGGLSLATGLGRRVGALVLAVSMVPTLVDSAPFGPSGDGERTGDFVRDLALTGGVLLAAGDTEGQPTLAYKAKTRAEMLGREAEHTKAAVAREAERTKKSLQREGRRAARKAKKVASKATKTIEGALK